MDAADKEYNHNVVIAATTASYSWIVPVGTVAAAVVAGVYGRRAVEALDKAKAAQKKINSLEDQIQANANLMVAINSASYALDSISLAISEALPVIQKIQGVWGGISNDLNNIVQMIDEDIRKALPVIMSLGVEEAMNAWRNVGYAADLYRINAYVTEQPQNDIQKEKLNLERIVSMARAAA